MRGNLWNPGDAPTEDRLLDLLVYRSRLLGADPELVVWGGGNTSAKWEEPDHRGRLRPVLRVKGSGTDLKTIGPGGFPGVFIDDVMPLLARDDMSDEEMVAYLEHCLVDPRGGRPSIETLLHAFLPARHIDHTHADAVITLTNTERGEEEVHRALGDGIAYVPWKRPGFGLSKIVAGLGRAEAVVLGNHGLVTWGDTAEESYRRHIEIVQRAEDYLRSKRGAEPTRAAVESPDLSALLPAIRGRLGGMVLRVESGPEYRAIANRPNVRELTAAGPATADHVLRVRPWACVVDAPDPGAAIDAWEGHYRAFFARHAWADLDMLSPLPKVFVVPGIGVVTAGRDARDAQVTADVALHTLQIAAAGTDAHGSYRSLDEESLFHVEYWPLELYKLTLAPPPRELAGKIIVVTGAASGIGRAIARHLAGTGAQLVLLDLDTEGLDKTAQSVRAQAGASPLCITVDLTDDIAVESAVRHTVHTFGGVDGLVSNAGIAATGKLADVEGAAFRRSLEVNTTSHFLITRAIMRVLTMQGLGGSMVYVASKNAFGPGAGFGPYSVAKAAQVQLARIAALEGGSAGIRANVVNPDAVFDDSKLWTDEVRRERSRAHGVAPEDLEQFYADRNLLKRKVTGQDVAEAVLFLLSPRSAATTGTVITVDGGVAAAFPR